MFTTKKNSAMNTGGMIASRSRGTARSARPAIVIDVADEAGLPGADGVACVVGIAVVDTVVIVFIG